MSTDNPSIIVLVATITYPEIISTYSTTYEVLVQHPTPTSWITSLLETTTLPASTVTGTVSIGNVGDSSFPSFTSSIIPTTITTANVTTIFSSSPTNSLTPTPTSFLGLTTTSSLSQLHNTTPMETGPASFHDHGAASKTGPIVAGVLVPVVIIFIAVAFLLMKKSKKQKPRNVVAGSVISHWFENTDEKSRRGAHSPPPLPPMSPTPMSVAEIDGGCFRVASPPRPPRPSSLTESVLAVMSQDSQRGSMAGETSSERGPIPIELGHLRSVRSLSDDSSMMTFIPNTDDTPVYDGTRNRYIQTALAHNMPLAQLSRPSLRVPDAPRPFQQSGGGLRRSSYFPEPLRVHKRSATDVNAPSARSRYVTNLEDSEHQYPSPVPTEEEFIANVRQGLSNTPPLKRAAADHVDLMADDSSVNGSFAQENEIAQKREESLATLEGRTPDISSSAWDKAQGRTDFKEAFAPRNPARVKVPIPEEQMAARRKANVITEDQINQWV